ncbi:MAG: hypothetical protein JWO63_3384 [Frankiales bacterium]|nr:hypothetical protein [Frankiales bacterium]
MLSALGVPAAEEELFRALLRHPGASAEHLAAETGREPAECQRLLTRLEDAGLVNRAAGDRGAFVAIPPDVAFRGLINSRQAALHRAEAEIVSLTREYRASLEATPITGSVEVLTGAVSTQQHARLLHEQASKEVLELLTLPRPTQVLCPNRAAELYGPDHGRRGLQHRTVIEAAALERRKPSSANSVGHPEGAFGRSADDGANLRIATSVPATVVLFDHTAALVALAASDESADSGALLVRPSALLDALAALFELIWNAATPLNPPLEQKATGDTMLSSVETQVLILLVSGLTDRAIAHQLGISERSVQRYVRVLMDLAAARSRLQLGWHAANQGWLANAGTAAGRRDRLTADSPPPDFTTPNRD